MPIWLNKKAWPLKTLLCTRISHPWKLKRLNTSEKNFTASAILTLFGIVSKPVQFIKSGLLGPCDRNYNSSNFLENLYWSCIFKEGNCVQLETTNMNLRFWQKLVTQWESILVGLVAHSKQNVPVPGDQVIIDELMNSLLKTTLPPL